MSRRHLGEAIARLERQREIVRELEARSHARAVELAGRELLVLMEAVVDAARRHVSGLERERTPAAFPHEVRL